MRVTEFLLARIAEATAELGEPARGAAAATAMALAGLEAQRAVLRLHPGAEDSWGFNGCLTCGNLADTTEGYPCPTVRVLAAVYADHPDYDEAWRP